MLTASLAATSVHAAAVMYKSVVVDGVKIAYRETGSADKPTLLLLHGVPGSSRMHDGLMCEPGDR
jgi:pimeloyl-ACP methyl ester carboxylesterase